MENYIMYDARYIYKRLHGRHKGNGEKYNFYVQGMRIFEFAFQTAEKR